MNNIAESKLLLLKTIHQEIYNLVTGGTSHLVCDELTMRSNAINWSEVRYVIVFTEISSEEQRLVAQSLVKFNHLKVMVIQSVFVKLERDFFRALDVIDPDRIVQITAQSAWQRSTNKNSVQRLMLAVLFVFKKIWLFALSPVQMTRVFFSKYNWRYISGMTKSFFARYNWRYISGMTKSFFARYNWRYISGMTKSFFARYNWRYVWGKFRVSSIKLFYFTKHLAVMSTIKVYYFIYWLLTQTKGQSYRFLIFLRTLISNGYLKFYWQSVALWQAFCTFNKNYTFYPLRKTYWFVEYQFNKRIFKRQPANERT